jgi:thioredoxin reductase
MDTTSFEVVIVGGGAAGLSAALVLGRARREVAVIDAGRPRNAPAAHMHGYLSRDGMAPSELLATGRAEARRYGVEILDGTVEALETSNAGDPGDPSFLVRLAGGLELTARRVLVTTGLIDEVPDLPGLGERWGKDVLHCPYCHGWEVRDLPLGVLGTIAGSVDHALLVRQWSDDVVFFAHTYELDALERSQLDARGIEVVSGPVARLRVQDDRLAGVELADRRVVARSAVFVRPGLQPHPDGLLVGLGCELADSGFVVTDATGRTTTPGVWAAGNAADPRAQVITAAGAGSAAAIAINADLVRSDVDRAMHARAS